MKIYLLKFFHFREREILPYRTDGRGGNVFHGVGSHVFYNDLRNRWYRFAFEVATQGQPPDATLLESRLTFDVHGQTTQPEQSKIEWLPECIRPTKNPDLNSYQWVQHACINVHEPTLVTVKIEFLFSNSPEWQLVDGVGRLLVDLHPGDPPKYYNYPFWSIRRWLR